MHDLQYPYHVLLEELGDQDNSETLSRWLAENQQERTWLQGIRELGKDTVPEVAIEDIWRLYALSRISDTLIAAIGDGTGGAGDLELFMSGLGLERIPDLPFHPFFHEIVTVTEDPDADAEIALEGTIWPGFLCGSLLIARAGVSVSAGVTRLRKSVAESSHIYWTYRRSNRPADDLSVGWGSNSQWRTSFRRDYVFDDRFEYNVDAKEILDDNDLTPEQRLELVRHRCFVLSDGQHDDLWPYDIRHTEQRSKQSSS